MLTKKDSSQLYDKMMIAINEEFYPNLSVKILKKYNIVRLKDLIRFLRKNAEYGGCITYYDAKIILPFYKDNKNRWLKYNNPRVASFYHRLYEKEKSNYNGRKHFDLKRFEIEESFQLNNWNFPVMTERLLKVPVYGCWDRSELIAYFLELKGYDVKRLYFTTTNIQRGHSFCIYNDGKFWRFVSFPENIFRFKKYQILYKIAFYRLQVTYRSDNFYRLIEFSKPIAGMNTTEYLNHIENGTEVLRSN